jgi:hypothetical protein
VLPGANSFVLENNYYFDNWRLGTMLFYVPSQLREESDPSRQNDTSNNDRQENNCMGVRPAVLDPNQIDFSKCQGTRDSNGVDFWWDEEEGADCLEVDQDSGPCVDASDGAGNCWTSTGANRNKSSAGGQPTSDPLVLPDCPGIDLPRGPNPSKSGLLVACATWNNQDNTDPPGCQTPIGQSWFDVPPEPQP